MTMQRVTDNLNVLPTPFFGIDLFLYLIDGDEVALIDSGINTTPDEQIFPAMQAAGLTPDLLICSHGHVDHFGGNAALQQRYPSMKTAIHYLDVIWAEDHERHLHEMYLCMPQTWQFEDGGKEHLEQCGPNSAIDLHLETGQQLTVSGFRFEVLHTPGHSPGHMVLHDPARQVAICGDVALGSGVTAPDGSKVPPYYYDPSLYVASMEKALAVNAAHYCTGHHGALSQAQMAALVEESKAMVARIDSLSLAALSAEPLSLAAIVTQVGAGMPDYVIGFHLNASVQAHLLRHCREGRARTVMLDDLKHYLRVEQ